jgi:hypothetical protein
MLGVKGKLFFPQILAEFLLVNLTSVYLGFIDPTRASDTGYFKLSCLETLHYPWDL